MGQMLAKNVIINKLSPFVEEFQKAFKQLIQRTPSIDPRRKFSGYFLSNIFEQLLQNPITIYDRA